MVVDPSNQRLFCSVVLLLQGLASTADCERRLQRRTRKTLAGMVWELAANAEESRLWVLGPARKQ